MATELQQACEAGNIEEVKKLVAKKKNLNATDKRGWTALHCAANKASEKENYSNPAFLTICQMLLKVRMSRPGDGALTHALTRLALTLQSHRILRPKTLRLPTSLSLCRTTTVRDGFF